MNSTFDCLIHARVEVIDKNGEKDGMSGLKS